MTGLLCTPVTGDVMTWTAVDVYGEQPLFESLGGYSRWLFLLHKTFDIYILMCFFLCVCVCVWRGGGQVGRLIKGLVH